MIPIKTCHIIFIWGSNELFLHLTDREVCKCPKCLQTNSVVEDIPIQISTNPECTSTQISGNAKLNVENLIEEYCNSKEPEMGPENISSEAWSNGSDLIFNKEDGKKDR